MAIIKIRNAAIDLDAAEIPNLPATKITSGTLDNARISLDAAEIPNLDTAKITTGTLADARVPDLNASKITAGTIATARLGSGTADATTFLRGDNTFAEAGGGMHTLISTATISNAATAAVTGMDSTYSRYLVTINNLVPANNEVSVYMQVIIGGSVQTGANYPYGNNTRNSGSGAEGNESGGSTFFKISKSDMGNATGENYSGEVTLYNPSETSLFKNIGWKSVYTVGNGTVDSNIGGGMYSSGQAAITGISIKMASGNITSAVIKLYGIT